MKPVLVLPLASFLFTACGGGGGAGSTCEKSILANLDAIHHAQITHDTLNDGFVETDSHPRLVPEPGGVSWGSGNDGFKQLKWSPKGKVYGQYTITARYRGGSAYRAEVLANCTDDSWAIYEQTNSAPARKVWTLEGPDVEKFKELVELGKKGPHGQLRELEAKVIRTIANLKGLAQ